MKPQILILELYIEYCKTKHLFVELTIKKIEKKDLSGFVLNLEINTSEYKYLSVFNLEKNMRVLTNGIFKALSQHLPWIYLTKRVNGQKQLTIFEK